MKCIFCESTFRVTKFTKDKNICPECDGTLDDLSLEDEEVSLEVKILQNPSGRTRPIFVDEIEE